MSDSSSPFAELKEDTSSAKKEASVPINVLSSTKPLPTTVKKPAGQSEENYSTLFIPATVPPYTADWFLHYLKQTRVLVILALATFFLILIIWIAALGKAPAYSGTAAGDCGEWTRSAVVPDVVSSCPPTRAQVYYPSFSASVNMGGLISVDSVSQRPTAIFVPNAVSSGYYTAVFLHPDSPSPSDPRSRSELQGIVTNMRLSQSIDTSSGTWIYEYSAPNPSANTGSHRYVWLVYRHSSPVTGLVVPSSNMLFDVEKWFTESWSIKPELVAANFFTARSNS